MKKEPAKPRKRIDFWRGLDGIFQGLGDLLQAAARVAEKGEEADLQPTGSEHAGSIGAVYGVSVRVAPDGRPAVQRFGNVRQQRGRQPTIDRFREPITDLLDEGDIFLVLAELPGLEQSDIRCSVSGKKVLIKAQSGTRRYYKSLLLPSPIDETKTISNYKNGILELRLWKRS